jgi:polyisoprenoid-binding protein YceI
MRLIASLAALALSACAFTADESPQTLRSLPTGQYSLEKEHASLLFRVKHLGLSWYTIRLASFDATLDFDPANPAAARITALVDTTSVRTEHPTDKEWDARLSRDLLRSASFPQASFTSTHTDVTGATTGRLTGDLTLFGITKPVTLDVAYNGGMAAAALYNGRPALGFSARGSFKRSDYGSTRYADFVGDEIELVIEAEFTRR